MYECCRIANISQKGHVDAKDIERLAESYEGICVELSNPFGVMQGILPAIPGLARDISRILGQMDIDIEGNWGMILDFGVRLGCTARNAWMADSLMRQHQSSNRVRVLELISLWQKSGIWLCSIYGMLLLRHIRMLSQSYQDLEYILDNAKAILDQNIEIEQQKKNVVLENTNMEARFFRWNKLEPFFDCALYVLQRIWTNEDRKIQ
ncbi:MAG: hypothetical protein EZS28_015122 [Streblomastix strix]|uniref:Uncharacterized protein n=1 Tax=Streblomastix strix TaxID=222440 RepID=A0A5J4W3W1_9EUKA|nr:MAG: hypothetical protein EZS28_015122 [Streblomastix strix]